MPNIKQGETIANISKFLVSWIEGKDMTSEVADKNGKATTIDDSAVQLSATRAKIEGVVQRMELMEQTSKLSYCFVTNAFA